MTAVKGLPQRVLVGVGAIGALVHVATLVPTALGLFGAVPESGRPVVLAVSTSLVIAMIGCALAILLVVRAGRRYEARGLGGFLVLIAVCWGSVLRFASLERGADGSVTSLEISISGTPLLLATLALALAAAALLDLSWRFPHDLEATAGRPIRRRWIPWALATSVPLLLVLLPPLLGRTARMAGMTPETMTRLLPWVLAAEGVTALGIVFGMTLLGVRNFVRGYRLADAESRRSVLWLLVGVVGSAVFVVASVLALLLDGVLPISLGLVSRYTPVIVLFAPLFLVVCVAVSILHAGAIDPRLALRRSTINGIAGTLGFLVFAGLENTLSAWVEGRLGLPGVIGSFLSGTAAAGVFLPVQRLLGRRAAGRPNGDEGGPGSKAAVGPQNPPESEAETRP